MAAVEGPVVPERNLLFLNARAHNHAPVGVPTDIKGVTGSTAVEATEEVNPRGKPTFEIEDHPIDEVRNIKVGVIGAGIAGITAGILLPAKLPGLDLRIYDKNADVVSIMFPTELFQRGY
jgi:hypothetical protein